MADRNHLLTPLELEKRSHLPTHEAAAHLNRRPQTLRLWAMEDSSAPLKPIRLHGRLQWPVASLRKLLDGAK